MTDGRLKLNEPMDKHTSWRVGGTADRFYVPADIDDLAGFLAGLPSDEELIFIGLGSNLLIRDGGIRGTVVAMKNVINELELLDDDRMKVGAGVPCARVARLSVKAGLSGAEFLIGIPGTMGGALAMNAGAFGGETWAIVTAVETIDRRGKIFERLPEDYEIGYRTVALPAEEWFISATLQLQQMTSNSEGDRLRELLARRSETQPMGEFSCGSVFRNPPGDYAARLIEACGLKGKQIGGARVSDKHANFIINTGNATAADIEELIESVAEEVEKKQGIRLECEVRIVGETVKC
ncbi:MAG: UDP-N-acetylmuramate dehydrogenase [Gammaproteobacteria bacterium]